MAAFESIDEALEVVEDCCFRKVFDMHLTYKYNNDDDENVEVESMAGDDPLDRKRKSATSEGSLRKTRQEAHE